jgi:hypothetical protein
MPETVPTPTTAELVAAIFVLLDAARRGDERGDAEPLFAVAMWLGAQVKAAPTVPVQ